MSAKLLLDMLMNLQRLPFPFCGESEWPTLRWTIERRKEQVQFFLRRIIISFIILSPFPSSFTFCTEWWYTNRNHKWDLREKSSFSFCFSLTRGLIFLWETERPGLHIRISRLCTCCITRERGGGEFIMHARTHHRCVKRFDGAAAVGIEREKDGDHNSSFVFHDERKRGEWEKRKYPLGVGSTERRPWDINFGAGRAKHT